MYSLHASNTPTGVHTHESSIDSIKHTPGMESSRDVTLIAFLTPYMKQDYLYSYYSLISNCWPIYNQTMNRSCICL